MSKIWEKLWLISPKYQVLDHTCTQKSSFKTYSGKFNKFLLLFNKNYHIMKIFLKIWGL
jgi:hypothetical protein